MKQVRHLNLRQPNGLILDAHLNPRLLVFRLVKNKL